MKKLLFFAAIVALLAGCASEKKVKTTTKTKETTGTGDVTAGKKARQKNYSSVTRPRTGKKGSTTNGDTLKVKPE